MFQNIQKMTLIYLAVIFFIGLDRFLKVFASASQTSEFNLLGEILKFNYKANYYIAFSLPLYGAWLKVIILLIILLLLFYLAQAWQSGRQGIAVSLFTIVMGAAGNLFDRFKYGYVIDYLDLKYFTVFNLADAMIVIGIFLMLIYANKKEAA